MRKFFLIGSAAISLLAVGCTSPADVCKSGIDLTCDRLFECSSDQVKSDTTFQSMYGTSASDCKTKLYAAKSCDARKDYDQACDSGKHYNLSKASECSDARKAQTCADFQDTSKTPAACAEVCK